MPPNSPSHQPPATSHQSQRIGLFGGSFDPVHVGHVALAEACRGQAGLDEVWFVPTAVQPHKPGGPVASDQQRVAMLNRAIVNRPGLVCSLVEIERGGVSYTAETLADLNRARPENKFFLLMGADTLHDLPHWRRPEEVLRLATPLVVHRPGEPAPYFRVLSTMVGAGRLHEIESAAVDMPAVDVSSSEVRRRVAAGESIEGLVAPSVAEFIKAERLYTRR